MWKELANCLVAINGVVSSVMPTIHGHAAMCDILRKLRADPINVDSILKCTFFWDWEKKKAFISRIKELASTPNVLDEACENCFHEWVSRAKNDPDMKNFVVDEGMLLAFVTASKINNQLPCRSKAQNLASSCSQGTSKRLSVYTGNRSSIYIFMLLESILLVVLAAVVRFCCVFWRKKKLQDQDLGRFLEKRRSLQLKKKAFDRTITELEQKATEEAVANEATMEELGELVRERQGIERKLSTTYSLGRDETVSNPNSVLPLYSGRTRSYSFQRARKESVTIFHTLSKTSSEESSSERDSVSNSEVEEELVVKVKGKAAIEDESSSDDEQLGRRYRRSPSEPVSSSKWYMDSLFVQQETGEENFHGAGEVVRSMPSSSSLWLKRRTFSSSN
ncbi:hypothetical protein V6N12_061223 [Hibiscus sabdariffa]|uniref:Uncharacterized protein n=1 Tax=Hibiscus sabdariffa TaxID=183260 RepID=A0ABR2DWF0_9ROSI